MAESLPAGYSLMQVDETPSTNGLALELAGRGEVDRLWVVAKRQTAGRGSRGRQWTGLEGNLFCSLILSDPADISHQPELTFVMALAVRDTVAELAMERGLAVEIELKWPNDVLLNGAKVSGILLESHHVNSRQCVIAGIGVNCVAHPEKTSYRSTDLRCNGINVAASDFLYRLAFHVHRRIDMWERGHGFAKLRRDWQASAKGIGEPIVVALPAGRREGIFEAIDDKGQLRLRMKSGEISTISAADIFFHEIQTAENDN